MSDKVYYQKSGQATYLKPIANDTETITLESPFGEKIKVRWTDLKENYTRITTNDSGKTISEGKKLEPKITAAGIMQEAIDTMVERGKTYDSIDQNATHSPEHPAPAERSMGKVVEMFNTLTGHTLSEEEGWDFMVLLKLVRASNGYKADNFVDGSAYFSLAGEASARDNKL